MSMLGCAATVWPLTARAQQPSRVRRIGVLVNLAADDSETQARVGAFLQGLQGFGWEIGGNARFEYRWAPDADSIRKHAVEITALAPDVILANANPTATGFATGNTHTADCVCCGHRSRCGRVCRKLGAPGWQCDRVYIGRIRHEREVVRVAQRAHARNVSGSRPRKTPAIRAAYHSSQLSRPSPPRLELN